MPPKTLLRLGFGFLFLAVVVYFHSGRWLKTRIFVPLDFLVTLDTHQIQSPPFRINLRETYFVSLGLDDSPDDWYEDGRCNRNLLSSTWRLYRLSPKSGQPRALWASSEGATRRYYYAEAFTASSGQYELEWDLPPNAACLNPRHPRLFIITGHEGYQQGVVFIQICCIFFGGTGAILVLLASVRFLRRHSVTSEALRIFPDMVLRHFLPIAKRTALVPIHGLPHWGLFCGAIMWILIFIFMIFGPLPSKGLFVRWRNRDAVVWAKSPWPDTLEVYVRVPARFFVNGQEVERSDLRAKLTEQLRRRAEWTVYFEADPDTTYMDDVYAIDTIQACGAKLFWITPKMREEWQHK